MLIDENELRGQFFNNYDNTEQIPIPTIAIPIL